MNPLPIVSKSGIDILFPSQYQLLVEHARDSRFMLMIVILFHTGMRYAELKQITRDTYDKRSGKLRIESTKEKCKNPERWITLTPKARIAIEEWIHEGYTPMSLQAYNERIGKIAKYHGFKVSGKTSRKTCESWHMLLKDDSLETCVQIGHSPETAYKHYIQNLPFIDEDIAEIKKIYGRN